MKKVCLTGIMVFVLIFVFMSVVQAQSAKETLNQYISDLQKNPNDYALQEKIIKHVQTMKQKPAIPEAAKKYMVRGKAAFKGAKETKEFNDAANEFQKALLVAPWLAEGYYNLGIVQDKAGQHAAATQNLKLYLVAALNAPDAEKVKELIYEIEYRQEKIEKESSPAAIEVKKQNEYEDWLKKIDRRKYKCPTGYGQTGVIDVRGKVIVWGNIMPNGEYSETFRSEIRGRESPVPFDSNSPAARLGLVESTLIISEDGDRMTSRMRYNNGDVHEFIYLWQR